MSRIRRILKKPLKAALRSDWLRQKIVYELRNDFYADVAVRVPLSHETWCPIARPDYFYSFSEIFVNGEYGDFLAETGLPRRWLDIGCHAGFFSLYLAWQLRRAAIHDFAGFMIDADPRVVPDVRDLLVQNRLQESIGFTQGAIGASGGSVRFALRDGMGSSLETNTHANGFAEIPVITADEIARRLAPPYDLIKLDIEGAETIFIEHYQPLYSRASWLLLEWHSWDAEGTAEQSIRESLAGRGFEFVQVIQPKKCHQVEGKFLTAGCHLYRNIRVPANQRSAAAADYASR